MCIHVTTTVFFGLDSLNFKLQSGWSSLHCSRLCFSPLQSTIKHLTVPAQRRQNALDTSLVMVHLFPTWKRDTHVFTADRTLQLYLLDFFHSPSVRPHRRRVERVQEVFRRSLTILWSFRPQLWMVTKWWVSSWRLPRGFTRFNGSKEECCWKHPELLIWKPHTDGVGVIAATDNGFSPKQMLL